MTKLNMRRIKLTLAGNRWRRGITWSGKYGRIKCRRQIN